MKCSSPGIIIVEEGSFFSLTSSCDRHFHKTSAATLAMIGNDGEDKTRAEEAEKATMAAKATATQEQQPP